MKASKDTNDTAQVDEYMSRLEHPLKTEIAAVREIILKADSKLAERVKWNAPSFFYKKDMAAFNLRQQKFVQIIFIFYDGAMIESAGLLEGTWKDRRECRFTDMEDVEAKKEALKKVVSEWVALIDNQ